MNKMNMTGNFTDTNKCDMCDWVGTNASLGPHFIKAHLKDVTNRIASLATNEGVTVDDIVKATGFPKERVRNRLRVLHREGRVTIVGQGRFLVFKPNSRVEFSILRPGTMQCSTCRKILLETRFAYRNNKTKRRRAQCKQCILEVKYRRDEAISELKSADAPVVEVSQTKAEPAGTLLDRLTERIYEQADAALKAKYKDEYEALVSSKMEQMLINLIRN